MELKLKDGSKDIHVTEEQYKKMVTTVRKRHFPDVTTEGSDTVPPVLANCTKLQAEKAEAAVFLGEARFFHQGNFTMAVIVTGGKYFVGATKRNKKDRSNPLFGMMTALSRAIQGALRYYLQEFAGEPVRAPMVAEEASEDCQCADMVNAAIAAAEGP
jgi:hypothetical protein